MSKIRLAKPNARSASKWSSKPSRNIKNAPANTQKHFIAEHNGFIVQISHALPELTPTEIYVAACVRGRITTKEMSALLNVSKRTIEDHRFCIRRKLGLDKYHNLFSALMGL